MGHHVLICSRPTLFELILKVGTNTLGLVVKLLKTLVE